MTYEWEEFVHDNAPGGSTKKCSKFAAASFQPIALMLFYGEGVVKHLPEFFW
jgi:hypothetical protein